MKSYGFFLRALPLLAGVLLASAVAGCGDDATVDPGVTPPDTARVLSSFDMQAVAGTAPLELGAEMTSDAGVHYKVSMLRFYVSRFYLLDSAGAPVAATLVDSAGVPLKYGVAFLDHAKPEERTIHILARKGTYKGIMFSIGVPDSAGGAPLNHADASLQSYPLDVDNDMYWSWNPGYVFLKIEGSALVGSAWQSFVYHVGGDDRMMTPRVESPFTIQKASEHRELVINANRLFVTPSGRTSPDMTGPIAERVVHGGPAADSMAVNAARSGFISLKQ